MGMSQYRFVPIKTSKEDSWFFVTYVVPVQQLARVTILC